MHNTNKSATKDLEAFGQWSGSAGEPRPKPPPAENGLPAATKSPHSAGGSFTLQLSLPNQKYNATTTTSSALFSVLPTTHLTIQPTPFSLPAAAQTTSPHQLSAKPTFTLTDIPTAFQEAFTGILRVHHSKCCIELPETAYDLKQYEEAEKKPKRMTPKNYSFDGSGRSGWKKKSRGGSRNNWGNKSHHSKRSSSAWKSKKEASAAVNDAIQSLTTTAENPSSTGHQEVTPTTSVSSIDPLSADHQLALTKTSGGQEARKPHTTLAPQDTASLETETISMATYETLQHNVSAEMRHTATLPQQKTTTTSTASPLPPAGSSDPLTPEPTHDVDFNQTNAHAGSDSLSLSENDSKGGNLLEATTKAQNSSSSHRKRRYSHNKSSHHHHWDSRKKHTTRNPPESSTTTSGYTDEPTSPHQQHSISHQHKLLNLSKLAHDMNLPEGTFLCDLEVPSHKDRNGAMDGDIVNFVLMPSSEWKARMCHIPQDQPHELLVPEAPREHIQLTATVARVHAEKRQKQHVGYLQPMRDNVTTIEETEKSCYFVPFDHKYPKFLIPIRGVEHLIEQEGYKLIREEQHTGNSQETQAPLPSYRENPHYYSDVMFVARLGKKDEVHHNKYPAASLKQILGKSTLETQLEAIISQNMLNGFVNFPSKVIEEVERNFGNWTITEKDMLKREDYRNKMRVFSIDPVGTKDRDDAFSIEKLGDNLYEVGIHIADVAHFLHPFSCVETEARFRTSSVYMVNQNFPMLPPLLSENLCSIQPGEDRFAVSLFVQMDARGKVIGTPNFVRTLINNSCGLSYDDVEVILEWLREGGDLGSDLAHAEEVEDMGAAAAVHAAPVGSSLDPPGNTADSLHTSSLKSSITNRINTLKHSLKFYNDYSFEQLVTDVKHLHLLSSQRRKHRLESGSVFFRNLNLRFDLHNDKTQIHSELQRTSQHMVEEMMLLTNVCAAQTLIKSLPEETILRVHRPPQEKGFIRFNKFCSKFGLVLNSSSQHDLNKLLQSSSGDLQTLLFYEAKQMMRTAHYTCAADLTQDLNDAYRRHYALNEAHYTHFTSPIRRYTDLMAQRLLLYAIKFPKPPYKLMYSVSYIRDVVSRSNLMNQRVKRAQEQSEFVFLQHTWQSFRSVVHSVSRNIVFLYIPDLDVASEVKVKDLPNFVSKQYFKEEVELEVVVGGRESPRVITFRPLQSYQVRIVPPPHNNIMGGYVYVEFVDMFGEK